MEFCGVEEIVFDGVTGTEHLYIAETGHSFQCCNLDVHRQGGRKAVEIKLVCVESFGFKEERMAVAFGKRNQFGLNGWAVARSDALYLSVVERRILQSAAENPVDFGVCVARPAGELWKLA